MESLLEDKVYISFIFVFLYLMGIQKILSSSVSELTLCGGFHIS